MNATAIGTSASPATSGEYPNTNWSSCVNANSIPANAKFAVALAKLATEKRGLRKNPSSSIGCAHRISQSTKHASSTSAMANERSVATDPQPSFGAWMVAHTNADTATTESTTPSGSNRDASGFRDSGTAHHARPTTTTTNGTFTRNTEPHQNCESSSPPSTGPSASPRPATADHTPNARARSLGSVNTFVRTAIEVGMISAAPNPMIPRQTISAVALEENAATADAIPNTTRPTCSTMARPKRSPRLPPTSRKPANTRM